MIYSFLFLLCFQITYKECTLDMSLQDFAYLSDHLTTEECHWLFASLHFVSYDLPPSLAGAEKKVPQDVPCIKLLLKWNSGQEKWEGKRRTHMEVEHRLRQIGRNDLADWLGNTVFHNLAAEMNKSFINAAYFIVNNKSLQNKLVLDKDVENEGEEWGAFDSMLWFALIGLLGFMLIVFCRIIVVAYRKALIPEKHSEELIDLLSVASAESDVEETIYEYRIQNVADDKNKTNVNKVKS